MKETEALLNEAKKIILWNISPQHRKSILMLRFPGD